VLGILRLPLFNNPKNQKTGKPIICVIKGGPVFQFIGLLVSIQGAVHPPQMANQI